MAIVKQVFIIIFLILFSSCKKSIKNEDNYLLKVESNKIEDGTVVFLKKQDNYLSVTIDSTLMINNEATFSGNIIYPEMFAIKINGLDRELYPIIEEGVITIEIINSNNINIYGTKSNDLINKYSIESKKITSKINDLFIEIQKARTENDLKKIKKVNQRIKSIINENNNYSINFIKNNSNSIVASIVLYKLINNQTKISNDTLIELYLNLDTNVKKNKISEKISVILNAEKQL